MRPSNGLTTYVLELVFGCLMMVFLFTGLCCILWHRRRRFNRPRITNQWKKFFPYSRATDEDGRVKCVILGVEQDGIVDGDDVEAAKAFSDDEEEEELADYMLSTGLIGLQSRLLFTIMEESREDLDSDGGRSSIGELSKRRSITRSLSDLEYRSSRHLFESVPPSPPPKFKFLRDADQKFRTRLKLEAEEKAIGIPLPSQLAVPVVKDDSWSKIVERRKASDVLPQIAQNHPSSSSRVLPLESSSPY